MYFKDGGVGPLTRIVALNIFSPSASVWNVHREEEMTPLPTTSSSAAPMESFCLVVACPGVTGGAGVVSVLTESVAL